MATFDPINKRIILDTTSISAIQIYSQWVDWAAESDNLKYGVVIRQVGSDDLGTGLSIPPYFFLQGNWRVRPMEDHHNLSITGNLFVEGGGEPVVPTLGTYQVNVKYTVPVQAQGISTSGSVGASAEDIAIAVKQALSVELARIHKKIKSRYNGTDVVPADVQKMNGARVLGTGTAGNSWRGENV